MRDTNNVLSREYLSDALLKLMEIKPYADITITDICSKAGVSRMTYYRNYNSKEEIVVDYFEMVGLKYIDQVLNLNLTSLQQFAVQAFRYYRENNQFIMLLNEASLTNLILDSFNKNFSNIATNIFEENLNLPHRRYGVYFFAGALYNIFTQWAKSGMEETDEEMASIITALMNIA